MITCTTGKDGRRYYFENGKRIPKPSVDVPCKTPHPRPTRVKKSALPKKASPKASPSKVVKTTSKKSTPKKSSTSKVAKKVKKVVRFKDV